MLHIHDDLAVEDDLLEVGIYDENHLRAATVLIHTTGDGDSEVIQIEVRRIENDPRVEIIFP